MGREESDLDGVQGGEGGESSNVGVGDGGEDSSSRLCLNSLGGGDSLSRSLTCLFISSFCFELSCRSTLAEGAD